MIGVVIPVAGTFCGFTCPPDTLKYNLDPFECTQVVNFYTEKLGDCGFLTQCVTQANQQLRQNGSNPVDPNTFNTITFEALS